MRTTRPDPILSYCLFPMMRTLTTAPFWFLTWKRRSGDWYVNSAVATPVSTGFLTLDPDGVDASKVRTLYASTKLLAPLVSLAAICSSCWATGGAVSSDSTIAPALSSISNPNRANGATRLEARMH